MSCRCSYHTGLALVFCVSFASYTQVFEYVLLLQYGTADCFFLFSKAFLLEWLDHPGGMLFYAGRCVRQLYHFPWLGAGAIAGLQLLFALILYLVVKRLARPLRVVHVFLPYAMLLPLHSVGVDIALGLIVVCAVFLLYLSMPLGGGRRICAVLATVLVYVLAGGYVWLFVVWVATEEWSRHSLSQGYGFQLGYPVFAILLPLAAWRWCFPVSLDVALNIMLFTDGAFAGLPLCYVMLLMPLWARVSFGNRIRLFTDSLRGIVAQVVLTIVLCGFLCYRAYDPATRQFVECHRLYQAGEWDELLRRLAQEPLPHRLGQFFTNYALAQKGRLLDEMFAYPQSWGTHGLVLSFARDAPGLRQAMYNSDLFLEMGHVNAAFRFAYNQMTTGRTYHNLKRIVECSMINGNYAMAAKYIDLLDRTLFHHQFVRAYRRLLAEPALADDEFAVLRSRRPHFDIDIDNGGIAALMSLVESDPGNRLAFDYLTAWRLLEKEAAAMMVDDVWRFDAAGYLSLPAYCQEALVVWDHLGHGSVDGLTTSRSGNAVARVREFSRELKLYGERDQAVRDLSVRFRNSYMYYFALVRPPPSELGGAVWVEIGRALALNDRTDTAEACYRQALRLDPNFAPAHAGLGDVLMARGLALQAALHYRSIVEPQAAPLEAAWRQEETRYPQDH